MKRFGKKGEAATEESTNTVITLVLAFIAIMVVLGIINMLFSVFHSREENQGQIQGFNTLYQIIDQMEKENRETTTFTGYVNKGTVFIGFSPDQKMISGECNDPNVDDDMPMSKKERKLEVVRDNIKCPVGSACLCMCSSDFDEDPSHRINCMHSYCIPYNKKENEISFKGTTGDNACDIPLIYGSGHIVDYCVKKSNEGYSFEFGACQPSADNS